MPTCSLPAAVGSGRVHHLPELLSSMPIAVVVHRYGKLGSSDLRASTATATGCLFSPAIRVCTRSRQAAGCSSAESADRTLPGRHRKRIRTDRRTGTSRSADTSSVKCSSSRSGIRSSARPSIRRMSKRQVADDGGDIVVTVLDADDEQRVERVEQKMRIHLAVQRRQLGAQMFQLEILLADLQLVNFMDQRMDFDRPWR